jgi:hypothetical protein
MVSGSIKTSKGLNMDWCLYVGCYVMVLNGYIWWNWLRAFQSRNRLYSSIMEAFEDDPLTQIELMRPVEKELSKFHHHANIVTLRSAGVIFALWRLT